MRFTSLRTIAAAAVLAAAAGLYLVGSTSANNPGGSSCNSAPSGGEINGRGATFQLNAQLAFIDGYTQDVCGPANAGMVQYNYPASAGFTGSGNGQKATSCRTDAFGASDIPYDTATLAQLNGTPGSTGGCAIAFTPPNPPNSGTYPDPSDAQAQVMTIPVAAGAVGVGVFLTKTACNGVSPATLLLTNSMVSKLFGGDILNWNDPALRAGGLNGFLANCNVAVTRDVRLDKSGTTQIFKNYLATNGAPDANRASAVCEPGTTWTTLAADANNTVWPNVGGTCSTLIRPATSGGPAVAALCKVTAGTVCYADVADLVGAGGSKIAKVASGSGTSFQAALTKDPNTGLTTQSNCDLTSATLPGQSGTLQDKQDGAVGLNPSDTWATDAVPNHQNITNASSKYGICGITFMLVYKGLSASSGSAINALSLDQRQTLYAYMTYILSSTGQDRLGPRYYTPLPASWLNKLRNGFQRNY